MSFYPRIVRGTVLVAALVVCGRLAAATPDVWISSKTKPQVWSQVVRILQPELTPDDPTNIAAHTAAYRDKHLRRVAGDDVVLALVGIRESARHPIRSEITVAYSVDLTSGQKEQLGRYLLWRFVRWAHFKANSTDAVFSYQSCDECEAERFVASFTYDIRSRSWKVRQWPEDGTRVTVGVDAEPGADEYQRCAYGVADYTGDGHDDIGRWCRTRNVKTGNTISEGVTIYTVLNAGPRKEVVTGEKAAAIQRQLCRQTPTPSACK
jgi:hypothetical protein